MNLDRETSTSGYCIKRHMLHMQPTEQMFPSNSSAQIFIDVVDRFLKKKNPVTKLLRGNTSLNCLHVHLNKNCFCLN